MSKNISCSPKPSWRIWLDIRRISTNTSPYPFRYITACRRSLPDFIIVGAQKSGTTAMYDYLSNHPQIIPPVKKEIHFFDWYYKYAGGKAYYRRHFPLSSEKEDGGLTFEATPYYLYHPIAPKRIYSMLGDVKIIFLLRDPVQRAISHYWHEYNVVGSEYLSMGKAFECEQYRLKGEEKKLKKDPKYYSFNHQRYSYLDRGVYLPQIERYTELFSENNLMFIKSSRFFSATECVLDEVIDFLGLSRYEFNSLDPVNKGGYSEDTQESVVSFLEDYFENYNKSLEKKTGISFS